MFNTNSMNIGIGISLPGWEISGGGAPTINYLLDGNGDFLLDGNGNKLYTIGVA